MRHSTTIVTAAAAATATAGLALAASGTAASAAVTSASLTAAHPSVVSASMELGNPLQYENITALAGHGVVDYTNWTYAEPRSGVWAPQGGPLTVSYQGASYGHVLNGTGLKLTALSPERATFTGTGFYTGQQGASWVISGQVNGNHVSFTIKYTGTLNPGYTMTASGVIAKDGSASGTATSSQGQALTWSMGAKTFSSVLNYKAPVQAKVTSKKDATISWTIPAKVAGLAGTKVTVTLHDGGRGAKHDTYKQGSAAYPIIGGPGVTIQK
jgi:hypothetical protein